jgi:hypothetical protein
MNERDRLKSLLEKNGYNKINSHTIRFMIDSTFDNNRCAIEINIDLDRTTTTENNSITGDNNAATVAIGKQAKI